MIKKGQMVSGDTQNLSAADSFIHWPPKNP